MRIRKISAYTAELHYAGAAYRFSGGRSYTRFTTTVVAIETDFGLTGFGEACPCGPAYMPAHAAGIVPALGELAPHLLDRDPRQVQDITRTMDRALAGHEVAKTAIDLACWDLLGKSADLPVHVLLGGRLIDAIPLHRVVPLDTLDATLGQLDDLRDAGFRHFQVKLGEGVEANVEGLAAIAATRRAGELFVGDANGAWRRDEALRVSHALRDIDCILEQPCREYDACLAVKRHGHHPVKLDEELASIGRLRRAIADEALDAAAIKLSRLGGITRSRIARDLCSDAGIAMTIEEAWGSGIASAAVAHLAASTDPDALLNATDIHAYNANQIARGAPPVTGGTMSAPDAPGLGAEPDFDALGDPVLAFPR